MTTFKDYFYGNKISDYGLKHGRVDYATLAKAFDAVLNNQIYGIGWDLGEWEQESGFVDNSEEIGEIECLITDLQDEIDMIELYNEDVNECKIAELREQIEELEGQKEELEEAQNEDEIFQFYIVSDSGAHILEEFNEIVFYNETLDIYLWGVTHYGTAWDYVLTDIPCEKKEV